MFKQHLYISQLKKSYDTIKHIYNISTFFTILKTNLRFEILYVKKYIVILFYLLKVE
jgi:hypothetical protein